MGQAFLPSGMYSWDHLGKWHDYSHSNLQCDWHTSNLDLAESHLNLNKVDESEGNVTQSHVEVYT